MSFIFNVLNLPVPKAPESIVNRRPYSRRITPARPSQRPNGKRLPYGCSLAYEKFSTTFLVANGCWPARKLLGLRYGDATSSQFQSGRSLSSERATGIRKLLRRKGEIY